MANKPIRLGVTGGIGAGKTIVCKIFSVLGIPVYNADNNAKNLMVADRQVVKAIKKYIGKKAYFPDGTLDRNYLANQVFKNEDQMEIINGIVHPAVARDFEKWSKNHEDKPYIVKEAALLIESGSAKVLDYIINVVAPMKLRVERILARDNHRSIEQINEIISNQLTDTARDAKSDFIITNDDCLLVIPQVLKIHEFLISLNHVG